MSTGLRYAAAAALFGLLFGLGLSADPVQAVLTRTCDALLPAGLLAELRQGTSALVTRKSLPAMLSYGLLYCGLCLVLIQLLRRPPRPLRPVLAAYGLGFAACALLLGVGKLGQHDWAYQLARRLIDGLVSPLPVVVLVPLLRWHQHTTSAAPTATRPDRSV